MKVHLRVPAAFNLDTIFDQSRALYYGAEGSAVHVRRYLDTELLETLCDVFRVDPGELLEREKPKRKSK